MGDCWVSNSWIADSWLDGSWCPTVPVPVTVVIESRRWPGPSIVIYRETDVIPAWQRKREDEEIVIL